MSERATQVKAFAEAIRWPAIQHEEIIKWADSIIAEEENSPIFIIDLSLTKNNNEALHILNENCSDADLNQAAKIVFGYLSKALETGFLDAEKVSKAIYEMAMEDFFPDKEIYSEMTNYWDVLDLAKRGIGEDYDTALGDMKMMLNKYKA